MENMDCLLQTHWKAEKSQRYFHFVHLGLLGRKTLSGVFDMIK